MDIKKALEALESETNIKFKDLLKICEVFFGEYRVDGSHHVFKTPWKGQPWVNIQKDKKMAKKYQVKQVKQALRKLMEMRSK